MIVFTSIIIVLVKANKRAQSIELAIQRRARLSRYEEDPQLQSRRMITSESTTNTTIYDMDYQIAIEGVIIATDKNIAYDDPCQPITGQTETKVAEHVYAQIH